MSKLNKRKPNPEAAYPQGAQTLDKTSDSVAGFTRVEEYLTPDRIREEFLWGISLANPVDGKPMSDKMIKNAIKRAYSKAELELGIDISPVVRTKRIEYDRTKSTQGYNMLDVSTRNIREVHELQIRTLDSQTYQNGYFTKLPNDNSNPSLEGTILYEYPLEWINMSLAHKGQISLSPLLGVPAAMIPNATGSGAAIAAFLSVINRLEYISGFWFIRYTSGFDENAIPVTVNEYVAYTASEELISLILSAIKASSVSISHDGSSQSVGNAQIQVLSKKLDDINQKLAKLKNVIKSRFSNSIFMSNI